jgi:hypothetical protein
VIALLRRIATRVVMLSIAAVLMALALGLLDGLLVKQHRMGKTNFKPACNGLACQGSPGARWGLASPRCDSGFGQRLFRLTRGAFSCGTDQLSETYNERR